MTAPVLFTDRLRLDGHRIDDLDPLAAIWQQPAVHGAIGDGLARPREEVWLRLLRSVGQWTLFGYGAWVLRERDGDRIVGEIGLLESRRAIEPALDAPEMGWMVAAPAHGRGYAREALAAILGWVDGHGIGRTVAIIDAGNAASIRVAAAAGYRATASATYHDRPIGVYARDIYAGERR